MGAQRVSHNATKATTRVNSIFFSQTFQRIMGNQICGTSLENGGCMVRDLFIARKRTKTTLRYGSVRFEGFGREAGKHSDRRQKTTCESTTLSKDEPLQQENKHSTLEEKQYLAAQSNRRQGMPLFLSPSTGQGWNYFQSVERLNIGSRTGKVGK